MVRVQGLAKRFGPKWLFQNLDIELKHGECLVVTGFNGSGKSTLLKCLAGLIPASSGKIEFGTSSPRVDIGYSALDLSTYPQLTAREHLRIFAEIRNCPPRDKELLGYVGLTDSDLPAGQLSSGQRSRLRLALAIQSEPKVLFLDEPGAAMDEFGRELVTRIVSDQLARGCAILATNDPLERRFATHVLEL